MPPKPKFTREEIAMATKNFIKENGLNALTARALAEALGSSVRPIFTIFESMEDVKMAAREVAIREFEAFASDFTDYKPAFKRVGMLTVSYAINEPELFKLVFMQEHKEGMTFQDFVRDLDGITTTCIELIQLEHGMTLEEAHVLYEQMWIHTYGLSVLCAMKVCHFSEEEIAKILGQVFVGVTMLIKRGLLDMSNVHPIKTGDYM